MEILFASAKQGISIRRINEIERIMTLKGGRPIIAWVKVVVAFDFLQRTEKVTSIACAGQARIFCFLVYYSLLPYIDCIVLSDQDLNINEME